jgi:hypothetical protein
MAVFMLSGMCILMFAFHFLVCRTALMVSTDSGLMLYSCMRLCSGVGWRLTSYLAVFVTGL